MANNLFTFKITNENKNKDEDSSIRNFMWK